MSRDLSYPALLVVLLTVKLPSILDQGRVSLETDRKAGNENADESISCRAQSKELQKAEKEADQTGKQAYQDNAVSDSEDNHEDQI